MKKWLWWTYIAALHLLVVWLIAVPGRKYIAARSTPIRFAWLLPAAAPEFGLSRTDVEQMVGSTEIAVAKYGDETIASFHLEGGVLDAMTFRWPGRITEHSISEEGGSVDMTGRVLSNSEPPEIERFCIDLDQDGLMDVEARSSSTWRARLRSEWVMKWRVDRATGRYEFFDTHGVVVARVTPDDAAHPSSWTVDRLDGDRIVGSENITDADFDLGELVNEFNPTD